MGKILKTLAKILLCALLAAAVLERLVYTRELDMASCSSDSLGPALRLLGDFRGKNGRDPRDAAEFYAFAAGEPDGGAGQAMHRFKEPFIFMPAGVSDPEGGPVLFMCPPGSHGFLYRYAFGVSEKGMVRIRSKTHVKAYARGGR